MWRDGAIYKKMLASWRGMETRTHMPSSLHFNTVLVPIGSHSLYTGNYHYTQKKDGVETEAKAKVVASVWGAKFVQFLAALSVLPRSIWKNSMNSPFLPNRPIQNS